MLLYTVAFHLTHTTLNESESSKETSAAAAGNLTGEEHLERDGQPNYCSETGLLAATQERVGHDVCRSLPGSMCYNRSNHKTIQ